MNLATPIHLTTRVRITQAGQLTISDKVFAETVHDDGPIGF